MHAVEYLQMYTNLRDERKALMLEPTRFEAGLCMAAGFDHPPAFCVERVETVVVSRRTAVVARDKTSSVNTVACCRACRTRSSSTRN